MFARVVGSTSRASASCSSLLISRPAIAVGVGRGVTGNSDCSHTDAPTSMRWQCRMYQRNRNVASTSSTDVDSTRPSQGWGARTSSSAIITKHSQHHGKSRGTITSTRRINLASGEHSQHFQEKRPADYPESVVRKGNKNNKSNKNSSKPKLRPGGPPRTVYVHPLSEIILQHLQNVQHDWVSKVGLNVGGLKINRDGSFVLRFPTPPGAELKSIDAKIENEVEKENPDEDAESLVDEKMRGGKLWTMYDPDEKKHWLALEKGALVGQYMLQDNMKPAWHSSKQSTPEKIQDAVDAMIASIDKADALVAKSKQSTVVTSAEAIMAKAAAAAAKHGTSPTQQK